MSTFKSAAKQILQEVKTPLHFEEITRLAIEKGILQTSGKTPDLTMNAQIASDIKKKGNQSAFLRTAPSTFALNPNKPKEQSKKEQKDKVEKPQSKDELEEFLEKIGSGYTGKAGEHYVTAELLFRGFNASIMSVDIGMDIIATKNNKLFSLQVKTSNLHKSNVYIFDMRKVALARNYAGSVFYLFIMLLPNGERSAVILPESKVEELIHVNAIKELKTLDRWRVTLKIRKERLFVGTLDHPLDDYYWNNWDIIK